MQPKSLKPRQALNAAFQRVKPLRADIERFKKNLIALLDATNDKEREEFHKHLLIDFLNDTYYKESHFINTKGYSDLVIHNAEKADSTVGVVVETKRPTNKAEMPTRERLNVKAFHELLLYYLRERITQRNGELKHLVITNINEWFIFDAQLFERLFAQNKALVKRFRDFEEGRAGGRNTDFFYKEIAEPAIAAIEGELVFASFNIKDYDKALRNADKKDDTRLIALYKLLSPEHLLKRPFANDSNSLDRGFYAELLHIIGLEDRKDGGKRVIGRLPEGARQSGAILENTILEMDAMDKLSRLHNPSQFGATRDERHFNVGLQLSITWMNRVLFLKLLEAQLVSYHGGDRAYRFLDPERIRSYDDLNKLFFQVLARRREERNEVVRAAFDRVPYLNSSLFEATDLEHDILSISGLNSDNRLPILSSTVLRDANGKRAKGDMPTLEYLLAFLDAYDFSSEGGEQIQEDNKKLINASVLGLIFEKINGYKDGSFFTPGFITMYMCRETLRRAVVQKFNEAKGWECGTLLEVENHLKLKDLAESNAIVNSLRVCDPAVGSGHFLVSALNELIAIKHELGILADRQGRLLQHYEVAVENDELAVRDLDGHLFAYHPANAESQRVQETLFHEKQTLIENCLFGVDINPNSVKICRLRLWIELLKNAYYCPSPGLPRGEGGFGELETLPNIDINIKVGNSLISRFALDADLGKALKKSKWTIGSYRDAVSTYRNAQSKDEKRAMETLIATIKTDFRSEITHNDKRVRRLRALNGALTTMTTQTHLFELSKAQKTAFNKKVAVLAAEAKKLEAELEAIKSNKIYENAFEWRFEFPEVLNDAGDFVGFDVVIGNPPYIRQEELTEYKGWFKENLNLYTGTADIYIFFIERGFQVLRQQGYFSYIMPNKFMQAGYGKPAREFLLSQRMIDVIDFGDLQVFEEATTYPLIFTASKAAPLETFDSTRVGTLDFTAGFGQYILETRNAIRQDSLTSDTWVISDSGSQALLQKLLANGVTLAAYVGGEAKRGVLTGLTEVFIFGEQTRNQIIGEDSSSSHFLKPVIRGRDVVPWYSKHQDFYLLGLFPALKVDITEHPAIERYLLSCGKERLAQTGEKGSRKKTSHHWFETQDSTAYWKEFEKPKIMFQKFQVKPCFIYDEEGLYCNDSMWIIPTDDKVLLGILNSKMGWWLISQYCTAIQNGYQLIWKYFGQIPIATGKPDTRKAIEERVNTILTMKKADLSADTTALEAEIDVLVHGLYGLTEEEVRVVEGK
ncbi:MAG: Eco57I restriction-modification methylase domain-containing protein [Flavobacteriales bacterium]|nr:Eco57I restriction-modification methylase domain-containing protein [Flavobacteriales bacterium]